MYQLAHLRCEGENEGDRGSVALYGSEEEDQETVKEEQINFGTVDLRHNLEDSIPEDGTGKEDQN